MFREVDFEVFQSLSHSIRFDFLIGSHEIPHFGFVHNRRERSSKQELHLVFSRQQLGEGSPKGRRIRGFTKYENIPLDIRDKPRLFHFSFHPIASCISLVGVPTAPYFTRYSYRFKENQLVG